MKALVLAAGAGSRISSISEGTPKPLLKIKGEAVLAHNLKLLAMHGIKNIWINLHHHADAIEKYVGDGSAWGVQVLYSREKTLLGTSGAVKNLEDEFMNETFLTLYGDNYTNCNLTNLLKTHKAEGSIATIAVFNPLTNPNSGVAGGTLDIHESKTVAQFKEGESAGAYVNAGIYALEPAILEHIPSGVSDFGRDVFPMLLQKGFRLAAYPMAGFCLGLDTPEAFSRAQTIAETIQ